jgi:hypothetical protein
VAAPGDERTFEVVAWLSERRLVLYVPEIEAATSLLARGLGAARSEVAMPEADEAARSLIADLTGIDASTIRCRIRFGRVRGASGTGG